MWNKLIEKYEGENLGYRDNFYFSDGVYDCESWDYLECMSFHPFDSTMGLSLYYDYKKKKEMFSLIFTTDGVDIDDKYLQNVSQYLY